MKNILTTLCLVAALFANVPSSSALKEIDFEQKLIPNQLIVELKNSDTSILQRDAQFSKLFQEFGNPQVKRALKKTYNDEHLSKFFILSFPKNLNFKQVNSLLSQSPNIESFSPNHLLKLENLPNDPYFSSSGSWGQSYRDLWGLENTDAETAWDTETGDSGVVIAVVDSGLDTTHSDINDNLYINPGEIAGNGIDDEGNGFIDDVYGYDFENDDADISDDHGHGTHVAGTIAAEGNNGTGITGVMWDAQVMAVKVVDASGYGSLDVIADGVLYAAKNGADVINLSLGGGGGNLLETAVNVASKEGVVVVAAAGNDGTDETGHFPSGYNAVIAVAASRQDDATAEFSNFGPGIDLAAPGGDDALGDASNVLSLRALGLGSSTNVVGTDYIRFRGTSMASPHVAGAAGLLLSQDPSLSPEEIRQILRQSADDIMKSDWDQESGFGRLNLANALIHPTACEALITSPTNYAIVQSGPVPVEGKAGGRDFSYYTVSLGQGSLSTQSVNWLYTGRPQKISPANGSLNQIPISTVETMEKGPYSLRLDVFDHNGQLCGQDYKTFHYTDTEYEARYNSTGKLEFVLGEVLASGDIDNDGKEESILAGPVCSSAACFDVDYDYMYLGFGSTEFMSSVSTIEDTELFPISWKIQNQHTRFGKTVEIEDIDGDSLADVLVGIPGSSWTGDSAGQVCVYLGAKASTWTRDMDESDSDLCFYGETDGDHLGNNIAVGDFDTDTQADIAISACGNDEAGNNYGKVYILYGSDRPNWSSSNNVNNASTEITGLYDLASYCEDIYFGEGLYLSNLGDINGDGQEDLGIGYDYYSYGDGAVYIFTGKNGPLNGGTLEDANIRIFGEYYSYFGTTLTGPGDVNGDGIDDILVGYGGNFLFGIPAGSALFFGDTSLNGDYDSADLEVAHFEDLSSFEYGYEVEGLGDINGDGLADMAMGAPGFYQEKIMEAGGIVYIVLGKSSNWNAGSYMGTADYILRDDIDLPVRSYFFGGGMAKGDYNGDGLNDLAVGAPFSDHVYFFTLEE